MEKHIYEIVYCGISVEQYDKEFIDDVTSVANKITTNMTKFIEWKDSNVVGGKANLSYWYGRKKFKTLEQIYQYWLTNIKYK